MRHTKTLVLSIIASVSSVGCVDKQLELEQLASVLSEIPVVAVLFPTSEKKMPGGSATVIGDRELLLSPHQFPPPCWAKILTSRKGRFWLTTAFGFTL